MLKFVNLEKLILKRAKTAAFHLYMQCLEREYDLFPNTNPTPMKNCLERCFQGCWTIKHWCTKHLYFETCLSKCCFFTLLLKSRWFWKRPLLLRAPHVPAPDHSTRREPAGDWPFTPVITRRPLERTLPQGKSLFVQRTGVSLAKKPPPHGSPMPWNNKHRAP